MSPSSKRSPKLKMRTEYFPIFGCSNTTHKPSIFFLVTKYLER
ncbi:25568_t:CDS:2, partial [Racocetra persica]